MGRAIKRSEVKLKPKDVRKECEKGMIERERDREREREREPDTAQGTEPIYPHLPTHVTGS